MFSLTRSTSHAFPILVSVPHAGLEIAPERPELLTLSREVFLRDVDYEVHRFWENSCKALDLTFLRAHYHRYVIDLNRAAHLNDDYVEGHPVRGSGEKKGLFWVQSTAGENLGRNGRPFKKLSLAMAETLIRNYWSPYYEALRKEFVFLLHKHGRVLLIDAHSMPSRASILHSDSAGSERADIVPGNLKGKSCLASHMNLLLECAKLHGYSTAANDPYSGGNITQHFSKSHPHGHVLQIEVNRKLYMNEETKELKDDGLKGLENFTLDFLTKLSALK